LIALAFLQLVDRYAMSDTTSTLPGYYWSVCLLAISSFGLAYVVVKWGRKLYTRIAKRSKRKAA
jgi:di/tricarboxylate transporter